ncbi:MAG: pantoate--beta-alanine ligase [Gammaproteobacteria bacterium]
MGSPALIPTAAGVRAWRAMRLRAGETVALVPTLGNLHAGHAALIDRARAMADFVMISVFVNPTQFAPGEDYAQYPRTLDRDRELAGEHDADAIFAPAPDEMYPHGTEAAVAVEVPGLSDVLCGASRPGHFRGVASVVARLFNLVAPEFAIFGEKDFQQLLIVHRMTEELFFPIEIVGMPTVREPDGLALSSRNLYLTPEERRRAPVLYATLRAAAAALAAGAKPADVEAEGEGELEGAGLRPDYFAVQRAADLGAPEGGAELVVLAAAWLGKTRLIDNIRVPPRNS